MLKMRIFFSRHSCILIALMFGSFVSVSVVFYHSKLSALLLSKMTCQKQVPSNYNLTCQIDKMMWLPLKLKKYPLISTKYPTPMNELWTRISISSHARRVAYYDNRVNSWGGPVLITLTFHDTEKVRQNEFYAKVAYQNGTETCLSNAPGRWEKIRVPKNNMEKVMGILLIFNLPTQEVPETMFISESSNCLNPSAYISVFYEGPTAVPKLEFAVCLYQAMFNLEDHGALAAWIEMNKQLGAQKVYIYFQNEPDRVKEVAQKYVDEGFVEAFDWNSNFTTEDDNNYGQAMLIVDCQYRSMYQAKYLLMYDMDELIVPRQMSTWHGLMKQIDHPKRSQFRFCSAYMHDTSTSMLLDSLMDNKITGCSNVTDIPVMFKRTQRTAHVNCKIHKWKNIVKPLGIKYLTVHSASPADGYAMYTVPVKVGLLYHYRTIEKNRKEKSIHDFTAQRYMTSVVTSLVKKFCEP